MLGKKQHNKRIPIINEPNPPTEIAKFRELYLKRNIELVDITHLCKFKLGNSGWCNDFNEPDEEIYHLQVEYRDEWIGSLNPGKDQPNWEDNYVVFTTNHDDVTGADFIIFRKVPIDKERAKHELKKIADYYYKKKVRK
jgi:hypothetical protein